MRYASIGGENQKGWYYPSGDLIREKGYPLESLAIIESMDDKAGAIEFRR